MCQQVCLGFILTIVLVVIQDGYGLQCWKCSSKYDITCGDRFDENRIPENRRNIENIVNENRLVQPVRNDPHLSLCNEMNTVNNYNQKNVCLKRVVKNYDGTTVVTRQCRLVPNTLKIGECPDDITNDKDLKFCGTCDTDRCNSAHGIRTNAVLAVVISASLVILLRN